MMLTRSRLKRVSIVLLALGALIGGTWFILANTHESQQRKRERFLISACWEHQGRKSNPPDVARTIAFECEGRERDFRRNWNEDP